jgi:hypothetical protein
MANTNAPNGFQAVKHQKGGMHNRRVRYHIAGGYASDIFNGDAVIPTATSKNITRPATAADRLQGIFDNCYYLDPNQSAPQYNRRWPASTTVVTGSTVDAWVVDDPGVIFEVQMSGAFTLAGIGSLADLILGTGNTFTKVSGDAIDSTTLDASGTVVKILDIVNRPDNAVGNFARVLVEISKHYMAGALTAI